MARDFERVYAAIAGWAKTHGISVRETVLSPNKAGELDGLSVTMNAAYRAEERMYYLVHALGSIVRWSMSWHQTHEMFQELRAAKKATKGEPRRLEAAIDRYRAFEVESSEFAVWLLSQLNCGEAIPSFTNFMRADLQALTQFHRHGTAPVWRDFFSAWNEDVRSGRRTIEPYAPKPIPAFEPTLIDKQEILQQQPVN